MLRLWSLSRPSLKFPNTSWRVVDKTHWIDRTWLLKLHFSSNAISHSNWQSWKPKVHENIEQAQSVTKKTLKEQTKLPKFTIKFLDRLSKFNRILKPRPWKIVSAPFKLFWVRKQRFFLIEIKQWLCHIIQCPLYIATLDIAAALPIATSTPVTDLCQCINSDLGYNDLEISVFLLK